MNYRELLKKYIAHVGFHEGVSFLGKYDRTDRDPYISDEEWAELQKLDKEVDKEVFNV